jgi:hypothetical protein
MHGSPPAVVSSREPVAFARRWAKETREARPPGRGMPNRALTAVAMAPLALLAGCGLFALGASVLVDPEGIARQEHVAWLGVRFAPCPGCALCGMSRAFSALAHGDLAHAQDFNRGVLLAWPLTVLAVAVSLFGLSWLARHPLRSASARPNERLDSPTSTIL